MITIYLARQVWEEFFYASSNSIFETDAFKKKMWVLMEIRDSDDEDQVSVPSDDDGDEWGKQNEANKPTKY